MKILGNFERIFRFFFFLFFFLVFFFFCFFFCYIKWSVGYQNGREKTISRDLSI